MSGGVDSSVAALLLKEQGYDVIGVTMRLWQEGDGGCLSPKAAGNDSCSGLRAAGDDNACGLKAAGDDSGCCGLRAAEDARGVAETLGIPFYIMDFRREFKGSVVDYFVGEYLQGRTPNPCIACNRHVKWEALLARSLALGADYVATGHYARIARLPGGRYALRRSVTEEKDQTYALYGLTQYQLAHTLMPVGEYEKGQIRDMALKAGLPVAQKPDSQEICFVPDGDYAGFIDRFAPGRVPPSGDFVTAQGNVLGRHKGITHYTIGQRRGLELSAGKRVYVTDIRPASDEVVIGDREELFTDEVFCGDINYMAVEDFGASRRAFAKIRYNHRGEFCRIEKAGEGLVRALFEKPVRAAAPGQSICFYEGEYVLGGGIIRRRDIG